MGSLRSIFIHLLILSSGIVFPELIPRYKLKIELTQAPAVGRFAAAAGGADDVGVIDRYAAGGTRICPDAADAGCVGRGSGRKIGIIAGAVDIGKGVTACPTQVDICAIGGDGWGDNGRCHTLPKATIEGEVAAAQRARIRLADGAAEGKATTATCAPAAVNR